MTGIFKAIVGLSAILAAVALCYMSFASRYQISSGPHLVIRLDKGTGAMALFSISSGGIEEIDRWPNDKSRME